MTKYRITVCQEDIDNGEPYKSDRCPIALAARRCWPGARLWVDGDVIEFNGSRESIDLPMRAQTFITRFDAGQRVKPFSFTVTG